MYNIFHFSCGIKIELNDLNLYIYVYGPSLISDNAPVPDSVHSAGAVWTWWSVESYPVFLLRYQVWTEIQSDDTCVL